MDIPKEKNFPSDSVQCNSCGGHGCSVCADKGWLEPKDNPKGRRCLNPACGNFLSPDHIAVYCSDRCAYDDA